MPPFQAWLTPPPSSSMSPSLSSSSSSSSASSRATPTCSSVHTNLTRNFIGQLLLYYVSAGYRRVLLFHHPLKFCSSTCKLYYASVVLRVQYSRHKPGTKLLNCKKLWWTICSWQALLAVHPLPLVSFFLRSIFYFVAYYNILVYFEGYCCLKKNQKEKSERS